MAELVDLAAYHAMGSQARAEFDLWLRQTTGLEVNSPDCQCFKVVVGEHSIWTWHFFYMDGEYATFEGDDGWFDVDGVWWPQQELMYFVQRFDLAEGRWDRTPRPLLR